MTQRARRAGQFEAGLLDILDQKILVDSMERRGLRVAGARLGAVIDDAVNPAGLERLEHRRVDVLAVEFEADHVMVVEMDDDGVERFGRHRQQVGRVERLADLDDVLERGLFEPFVPVISDFLELVGERHVLRVNGAARSDDSRIQLGHVTAAGEYVGDFHAGLDSVEREDLIGPASGVERLVGGGPLGRVDCGGDVRGYLRLGHRRGLSCARRCGLNLRARGRRDPGERRERECD